MKPLEQATIDPEQDFFRKLDPRKPARNPDEDLMCDKNGGYIRRDYPVAPVGNDEIGFGFRHQSGESFPFPPHSENQGGKLDHQCRQEEKRRAGVTYSIPRKSMQG